MRETRALHAKNPGKTDAYVACSLTKSDFLGKSNRARLAERGCEGRTMKIILRQLQHVVPRSAYQSRWQSQEIGAHLWGCVQKCTFWCDQKFTTRFLADSTQTSTQKDCRRGVMLRCVFEHCDIAVGMVATNDLCPGRHGNRQAL